MSDNLYISRSFTELGAFRPDEVIDFYTRRILTSSDYVRLQGTEEWITLDNWMAGAAPGTATTTASAKEPSKPKDTKDEAAKPKAPAKSKKTPLA